MWTVEAAHYSAATADYQEMQRKCRTRTTGLDLSLASGLWFLSENNRQEQKKWRILCVFGQSARVCNQGRR